MNFDLLDELECSGEIFQSPELQAMIAEIELWEDPSVLKAEVVETYAEALAAAHAQIIHHCSALRDGLQINSTDPKLTFQSSLSEIQTSLREIQKQADWIVNLAYQFSDLLQQTRFSNLAATHYYLQGVAYCANYLSHKANIDALTQEFDSALRPNASLQRIFRYLNLLPSLFEELMNRLIKALWSKVPHAQSGLPFSNPGVSS